MRISPLTAVLAIALSATTASAQISYTWTGTEPTMTKRLNRNGVASVAGVQKAFPGVLTETVSYTTFGFRNASAGTATFAFDLLSQTAGQQVAYSLYLGSFNPLDLSVNYLGDAGNSCIIASCSGVSPFAVDVAAGADVVLVLNSVNGLAVQGRFLEFASPGSAFVSTSTVPEPSTYALMAAGLVAMGIAARRRRPGTRAA